HMQFAGKRLDFSAGVAVHQDVEERQIGRLAAQRGKGSALIAGAMDAIAPARLEAELDDFADLGLVIDDEKRMHGASLAGYAQSPSTLAPNRTRVSLWQA